MTPRLQRLSVKVERLALILLNHRADDLIPEESDTVLLALKRLPPKEAYDRVFRLRRAFQVRLQLQKSNTSKILVDLLKQVQCSLAHQLLPADQQTTPEDVGF